MLKYLVLKMAVGVSGLRLINSVNESWLEARIGFPKLSKMALNTHLPF